MSRHIKLDEEEWEQMKLVLRTIEATFPDDTLSESFYSLKEKIGKAILILKPPKTPPKELKFTRREIDDRYAAAVARLWSNHLPKD